MAVPPSADRAAPVTVEDALGAEKTPTLAISFGRRGPVRLRRSLLAAAAAGAAVWSRRLRFATHCEVATAPGETALTCTPFAVSANGPSSCRVADQDVHRARTLDDPLGGVDPVAETDEEYPRRPPRPAA